MPKLDVSRRTQLTQSIIMIVAGVFMLVAWGPVEIILYSAGALLALSGLVAIVVLLIKRRPWPNLLGALLSVLFGAAIAVHDFFPVGPIIHITAAIGALTVGVLQILGVWNPFARFSAKRKSADPATRPK